MLGRNALALLVGSILALATSNAIGQSAPKKPASKPKAAAAQEPAMRVDEATLDKLRSGDAAQVKAALDDVRTLGKAGEGAAPVIAQLLQKGLTSELTLAALDTLGDVEAESSSEAVAWYASHRSVALRQAAVKALIHTKGPIAVRALRHALSDADAVVRGTAATGLGTLKAKDAVPDLFVALDHRVGEAAAAIGQLCAPSECDQLASKLGKLPFDVVTGGLDQVLFRPPAEISDDEKVKMVGRVRELGTADANKFLRDVQQRWPATWSPRVKQAIDQGVLATGGGVL
jgi:HEAT repeat protein